MCLFFVRRLGAEARDLERNSDPLTEPLETVALKPKKANVSVKLVALAWAPYWVSPAGETAAVASELATAVPAPEVAVTKTLSECPTSSVTGRYDSALAPAIGAQFAPAASQRRH